MLNTLIIRTKFFFNSVEFIIVFIILLTILLSFIYVNVILMKIGLFEYIIQLNTYINIFMGIGIIFVIVFMISLFNIYKLLDLNMTEKVIKYLSIFFVVFIFFIHFIFESNYFKYDIKQLYIQQQNIKSKNNDILSKRYKDNDKDFIKFKNKNELLIESILIRIKFIVFFCFMTLFLTLSNRIMERDQDKKYYLRWYLSEKFGWILGSIQTKTKSIRIQKPEDCLEIIEIVVNYDIKRDDLYANLKALTKPSINIDFNPDIKYMENMTILFRYYDKNKIDRVKNQYSKYPKIIEDAIEVKMFKDIDFTSFYILDSY